MSSRPTIDTEALLPALSVRSFDGRRGCSRFKLARLGLKVGYHDLFTDLQRFGLDSFGSVNVFPSLSGSWHDPARSGTGMGLGIVTALVKAHQGTVLLADSARSLPVACEGVRR